MLKAMRSRVPSPMKLLRLLLFVGVFALMLQFSISYARMLHGLASPSTAGLPAPHAFRYILDRLRSKQDAEGEAALSAHSLEPEEAHAVGKDGLLQVNPAAAHPIYQLISEGKRKWDAKLARASKSLPQAVQEYKRRYGRNPPNGFDRWWKYAAEHRVQLPDEYDQILRDLEPFWAMRPALLRRLRAEAAKMEGFYSISCANRHCSAELNPAGLDEGTARIARQRMDAQLELVKPVERLLPDVDVTFYAHDVPWQFVGHDFKSTLEDMVALGEYYDESAASELDTARTGWASACSPTRPLRSSYDSSKLPPLESLWDTGTRTLVSSHKDAMDPCLNPTLVHTQGFLLGYGGGPRPAEKLYPALSMCKTSLHGDVLAVANEGWTQEVGNDPKWAEKKDHVLWRGSNTGIFVNEKLHWNMSQRMSLVSHTARTEGSLPVLNPAGPSVPVGEAERKEYAKLNKVADIGFTSPAIQCDPPFCKQLEEEYAFKDRVEAAHTSESKYLLDVDGNGWSARFKRLISSRSAVLKATIFPEWYSDRIQEWVHYIPLKADVSDFYDVTAFFLGGGSGDAEKRSGEGAEDAAHPGLRRRGVIREPRREGADRDALGREIGEAGRVWSHTFWRKEDMVAYQFRLFLELARLFATDRDAASYVEPMSDSEGDIF